MYNMRFSKPVIFVLAILLLSIPGCRKKDSGESTRTKRGKEETSVAASSDPDESITESAEDSTVDSSTEASEQSTEPELSVDYPDIESYFEERSEIKAVTPVSDSTDTLSEEEVTKLLASRGFTGCEITTSLSITGSYGDPTVISDSSSTKHPMYETYYKSSSDVWWTIFIVDESITATPTAYNLDHLDNPPITISETNEIVSYDISTNSFYRTIPNGSVMDVRIVEKIDTSTLDSMTAEVLGNG